jgi:hypothetical protein
MGAGLLGPLAGLRADEAPADPLPIRRIQLPAERLDLELARVRQGVLVQLSRDEFEAKVRAAAAAGRARQHPPRLLQAQYRARLQETALVGSGDWKITAPEATAAVLELEPLNLALQNVKVQKSVGETSNAILGQLDGKTLGLLLGKPGEHVALFDWSARGNRQPDGTHFELQIPPCALTVLELNLPEDQALAEVQAPCLLAGPPMTEPGGRRLWRIQCPGQAKISFQVRTVRDPGQPVPLLLVHQENEQRLTPGLLQADYRLELQALYGGVLELHLECDPGLRLSEVQIRSLQDWQVIRGPDASKPFTVIIRLSEPVLPGPPTVLQVRSLAPLSGSGSWTSPGVRLLDLTSPGQAPLRVLDRGEALTLRVHPDVQLENWRPGGFRFASPTGRPATHKPAEEQVLRLVVGADAQGKVQRPGAGVKSPALDFRARQMAWWQVGPEQATLTAQITYEVTRGRLFRLPVRLPPRWKVEQVELTPTDLLQQVSLSPGCDPVLVVDLQHPLGPSVAARLTLRLRAEPGWDAPGGAGATPSPLLALFPAAARGIVAAVRPVVSPVEPAGQGGVSLPFPEVVPLDARLREGALAISVDPAYQASVTPGEDLSAPADEKGPWAGHPVDFYYPYRGRQLRTRLVVAPRPPRLSARCTNQVLISGGRATVGVRLTVQADAGRPETFDLHVSSAIPRPWEWKVVSGSNPVISAQCLTGLELPPQAAGVLAQPPLGVAALLIARPVAGQFWRLRLGRPLQRQERIVLETTLDLIERAAPDGSTGQRSWEVPLIRVSGADIMDGLVMLQLAGAESIQVLDDGLQETAAYRRTELRSSWRVLQYGHAAAHLTLVGRRASPEIASGAVFGSTCLTTYVQPDDRLRHHFSFQVSAWQQPLLPLRLPVGARILAVRLNGRWLSPAVQTALGGDRSAAVTLLPVPAGPHAHRFEVLYEMEGAAWALQTYLEAPAPVLPVREPVAFRRLWYLPPGVVPLAADGLRRLPGVEGQAPEQPSPLDVWRMALQANLPQAPTSLPLRRRLVAASTRAAGSRGRAQLLGDALDDLAFELLREQVILVLDAAALQEVGLAPTTRLSESSAARPRNEAAVLGEEIGLAYVPVSSALLVTTHQQVQAWSADGPWDAPAAGRLAEAVATAARDGHDPSGRFRTLVDWLQPPAVGIEEAPSPPLLPDSFGPDWIAWEPVVGNGDLAGLRVVSTRAVSVGGVALAAFFTLLFGLTVLLCRTAERPSGLEARRPAPGRAATVLVLADLAGAGLALLWLPPALDALAWWPALAGLTILAFWLASYSARRPAARAAPPLRLTPDGHPAVVGALLAVVCLGGLTGRAAAPAPIPVYLVPPGSEASAAESVLAPPDLIARLDALCRAGQVLKDAVIVEAQYQGTPAPAGADERFHFVADYQVQCLRDGPAALTVPLGGVEVEVAYLDGAQAFPIAVQAPQPGYRITLDKPGPHHLQFQFTIRPSVLGEARELGFSVPPVVQSQLRVTVPGGSRYLESVFGRGASRLASAGIELTADLGSVQKVALRWRQADRPLVLHVKEAYYWDLGPVDSRLLAVFQYTVRQGATAQLLIDLPPGLDVRRVEAGSVPGLSPPPPLAASSLAALGNGHRLGLTFQGPVTTGVQVVLELVPRQAPFGGGAPLPFPLPRGAVTAEGLLGYRLHELEASDPQHRGVTFLDREAFARQWRAAGVEDLGLPARAYTFRRPVAPILQLDARPAAVHADCTQEIRWQLGERQADVRATAHLTAPIRELFLIDWQVPAGVTVTDVTEVSRREGAARVRQWNPSDGTVRIWLDHPVAETTLQLVGWMSRPGQGDPARFDLPCLRVHAVRSHSTSVRLTTVPGLVLDPDTLDGLAPLPHAPVSTWERSYGTDRDHYGGKFRTRRTAPAADVRTSTLTEVRDRRLAFVAWIEFRVRRGELRTAAVHLANWKGKEVQLEADQVAHLRTDDRDASSRTWWVELRPGITGAFRVTLRGSVPVEGLTDVLMPDVHALGVTHQDRWVAVVRPELEATDPWGLVQVPEREAVAAFQTWPGQAERLRRVVGSVWRVQSERWQLRLQPRAALVGPGLVQVVLAEQRAAVLDDRRWVHEASYWLFHEAGTALDIQLPAGSQVLTVGIDGLEVPRFQPTSRHLWLPLPGGAGAREVTLRWVFEPSSEPFERPNLEVPRLGSSAEPTEPAAPESAEALSAGADVPTTWTIHVPAGYQLGGSGGATPASAAVASLYRAQAEARVTELLLARIQGTGGEALVPQLRLTQERFYRYCREAEYQLAAPGASTVPGVRDPPAWLATLKAENRHRLSRFEDLRASVERQTRLLSSPEMLVPSPAAAARPVEEAFPSPVRLPMIPATGTPTYWLTPAGPPSLHVSLGRTADRLPWSRLAASALLVLLLLGVEARLVGSRGAGGWSWRFWPEQLAGLALLAWPLFGLPVAAAFLFVAVCGRLAALLSIRRLRLSDSHPPAPRSTP